MADTDNTDIFSSSGGPWVLFWSAPEGAGNVISLRVSADGKLYAECEHGLFEILQDGSSVGVLS